jgi:hypothetical protein
MINPFTTLLPFSWNSWLYWKLKTWEWGMGKRIGLANLTSATKQARLELIAGYLGYTEIMQRLKYKNWDKLVLANLTSAFSSIRNQL